MGLFKLLVLPKRKGRISPKFLLMRLPSHQLSGDTHQHFLAKLILDETSTLVFVFCLISGSVSKMYRSFNSMSVSQIRCLILK